MPTQVFKILGQSNPSINTNTTLYTVPAGNSAVISSISVCNANVSTNHNFSIAVVKSGEVLSAKHYIAQNNVVGFLDTVMITCGLTLSNGDSLNVFTTGANTSFGAFGSEIY